MLKKTRHLPFALTLTLIGTNLTACGGDGPCADDGGVGETGYEPIEECAPFADPETVGSTFTCQGQGTGWLTTDIYGVPELITSCLAYDTNPIPEYPTADDCGWRSMSTITSAFDVPDPSACCTDSAAEWDIAATCVADCGYAAVKVAIEAIRTSADNIVVPDDLPSQPFETSRADLYAFADYLESPSVIKYCADKVSASPGQVVAIGLGSGPSSPLLLGHIKSATLHLSCAPNVAEPFVANPGAGACEEPANIPAKLTEQESAGAIHDGGVTVFGPGVNAFAQVTNASFELREVLNRDMSVEFTLTRFDATLADASAGSFEFSNARVALANPASGWLEDEKIHFAPGMLRFVVTASIHVDGEPLFEGAPSSAEYTNNTTATAVRGLDGSFAFVDATFQAGEYTAVLNTEPAPTTPIQ
jgi:hypothetical protein